MPVKRTFTRRQLDDWELPYSEGSNGAIVMDRITGDQMRWHTTYDLVFAAPDDSHTYRVTYFRGNTEYQDQDAWDGENEVTGVRVDAHYEFTRTWQPVEDVPLSYEELRDDVLGQMASAVNDGVFLKKPARGDDGDQITRIGWRSGARNPLAEVVAQYARRRTLLDLNGVKFWVEPCDGGVPSE